MTGDGKKFILDTGDHDRISRVLKGVFGVVSIAVAAVTAVVMYRSGQVTTGSIVAVAFLFLFGIWLIMNGLGVTERYLVIADDTITIRDRVYASARVLTAAEIKEAGFSQLRITLILKSGERLTLRLGAFYRENSFHLMDAVSRFCADNGIATNDRTGGENEETLP